VEDGRVIAPRDVDELCAYVGQQIPASAWQDVTRDDVDGFAEAAGDNQWIHGDVARARESQLGGTMAHGFYALSLAPKLIGELISFERFAPAARGVHPVSAKVGALRCRSGFGTAVAALAQRRPASDVLARRRRSRRSRAGFFTGLGARLPAASGGPIELAAEASRLPTTRP
jgi:MaoC like domain